MEKLKLSVINIAKISHDIDQLLYLKNIGQEWPKDRELIANLETLKTLMEQSGRKIVEVDDLLESLLGVDYFFSKPARSAGQSLLSALRPASFEAPQILEFKKSNYKIYVFDEVLENTALVELQHFFKEAMIWLEVKENLSYLFTDARYGMSSPLLVLLQNELKALLQPFCGAKEVIESWAMKYDLTEVGIPAHADQVNGCFTSNLWVTPDTSNLDRSTGGMKILNLTPPRDWPWPVAITEKERITEYIEQQNPEEICVPYRANRLILFNSELFHKTNSIKFGPGYEDRRVSLTHIYR